MSERTATHDTVYVDRVRTETLRLTDSVWHDRWHTQYVAGDTVYRVDSLVMHRVATVHDTVRMGDTVRITHTEKQEVAKERRRPAWMFLAGLALAGAVLGVEAWLLRKFL